MIKSIIFDLGRVLLTFEPKDFLHNLYGKGEKAEVLYKAVFGSKTWLDLDRGTIDGENAINEMTYECSEYTKDIQYLINHWVEMMLPIEGSIKLLKELKSKDYNLFLLSNFHKKAYDKVFSKYSFFEFFDGIFISSHYALLKPEREIFIEMLNKFNLNPVECLFIDDTPVNISAAKELGMEGIVFTNPASLKRELISRNILEAITT